MFSFLLVFQLALAVTNPLPLFAYVDTLTGGDTCESLTYSPRTPGYPPPRHASPGTGNTYPLTQEPLSYYLLQGFSLLLACGKVFNIWRELPVARCALPVASRVANEPHDTFISIFIFHLPQHKENFNTFLLKFFFALSALYKFVSGSSLDEDDDTRDSCQLSSAKILTVIMRHMQITLSEA